MLWNVRICESSFAKPTLEFLNHNYILFWLDFVYIYLTNPSEGPRIHSYILLLFSCYHVTNITSVYTLFLVGCNSLVMFVLIPMVFKCLSSCFGIASQASSTIGIISAFLHHKSFNFYLQDLIFGDFLQCFIFYSATTRYCNVYYQDFLFFLLMMVMSGVLWGRCLSVCNQKYQQLFSSYFSTTF